MTIFTFIVAAFLALLSIGSGLLFILTFRRSSPIRRLTIGMITALSTVALIGTAALMLNPNEKHDVVWVTGVRDSQSFDFEFSHVRVYAGGDEYVFSTGQSWADIQALLTEQFPDGQVLPDGSWLLVDPMTPVLISQDDARRNTFVVETQVAVHIDGDSYIRFVFPHTAAGVGHFTEGEPVSVSASFEDLADFYSQLPETTISESTIEIPTSRTGQRLVITYFSGNIITISRPTS